MINYCDWCERPGVPYEYKGQIFDGLCPFKGDKLCPSCRDARDDAEGVDILVVDDRPGMAPYVYNTVRDRDKISIQFLHICVAWMEETFVEIRNDDLKLSMGS